MTYPRVTRGMSRAKRMRVAYERDLHLRQLADVVWLHDEPKPRVPRGTKVYKESATAAMLRSHFERKAGE